ncbi:HNH endonuclease [Arthrobacter sp. ERGS1:01]|uniref:HNH endonuclease n=1 Tax=Arthrobacter sp. ERGS1:01 TaxID=1704044 RepID=UPI000A58922E|nr:HNH endonuclease signature motif containing protein [Arthrobacter sp. ERGS1:01]
MAAPEWLDPSHLTTPAVNPSSPGAGDDPATAVTLDRAGGGSGHPAHTMSLVSDSDSDSDSGATVQAGPASEAPVDGDLSAGVSVPGVAAVAASATTLGLAGIQSADCREDPVDCGALVGVATALTAGCSAFFDPVVVAQLDAALAHVLADRAAVRAGDADDLLRNALGEGRSLEAVADLAGHAGGTKTAATKAATRAGDATAVLAALGGVVEAGVGFDPFVVDRVDPGALVDVISAAEGAKNALCAVQARAEVLLMAQQRLTQARSGIETNKLGQGVGTQIGLARSESPHRGRQLCELAQVLVRELPHTLTALGTGALNEYRAGIIARETVFLTQDHRAAVDNQLCTDPRQLSGWGNRELAARARKAAYRLEPEVFVQRLEKAETDRYVSLRPAADGMTLLTALLPLRHGVKVLATLTRIADNAKAAGDVRGKGQLMADTLLHRLTNHTPCTPHPNPDRTPDPTLEGSSDPSETPGVRGDGTPPTPLTGTTPATADGPYIPGIRSPRTGGSAVTDAWVASCTQVVEPEILVELIMTDRALFDGANDPAILTGYDPIPAPTARTWILGTTNATSENKAPGGGSTTEDSPGPAGDSDDRVGGGGGGGGGPGPRVWLKRLFTHPGNNILLAMDSKARLFPEGMKEFLRLRDQRCATPWCDAPIRQYDHIKAYAAGGPTTVSNGQGLCTACNQIKETPGWHTHTHQPENPDPDVDHYADNTSKASPTHHGTTIDDTTADGTTLPGTRITTPTGHHYTTQPPPLPGTTA